MMIARILLGCPILAAPYDWYSFSKMPFKKEAAPAIVMSRPRLLDFDWILLDCDFIPLSDSTMLTLEALGPEGCGYYAQRDSYD